MSRDVEGATYDGSAKKPWTMYMSINGRRQPLLLACVECSRKCKCWSIKWRFCGHSNRPCKYTRQRVNDLTMHDSEIWTTNNLPILVVTTLTLTTYLSPWKLLPSLTYKKSVDRRWLFLWRKVQHWFQSNQARESCIFLISNTLPMEIYLLIVYNNTPPPLLTIFVMSAIIDMTVIIERRYRRIGLLFLTSLTPLGWRVFEVHAVVKEMETNSASIPFLARPFLVLRESIRV